MGAPAISIVSVLPPVVNLPTAPYDHAAPDKYGLPLDTELIPYRVKGVEGW